ncbi:SDR family oxidoreductase [Thermoanaerobacterium thermosaccharolyticum]|uniref:SDR family oxidoreductase n=1 Tax=Thermoanaerobacterium thermosaccharolyticum TaxID=1517 RepID=UPI000C08095E|nr:NmrA family NAD(P)-binding protein [Thermoanaerobacterium thermosaccharolyticum]
MLLVTGITGHSGKYFLKELIKNKYEGPIRCIVRETSDTSLIDSSGLNIEKVVGNLNDQEFIDKAMAGVDTVIHIASIFYSVNIIKAAVKYNVKRAILVHTTGIYSKYKSASKEYKEIEQTIDKIIKQSNSSIGLIYLRPTMIYGYINDKNMIVFIKMVDKLRLFPVIDHGKNLLQPVNGRDLGKAYYQVLTSSNIMNGDYILSGEKPISMLEMFNLISKNLNKRTVFFSVPLGLGVFLARCLKVCTFGKVDYIEKVQRMGEDRSFPHDAAERDFGYKPMPFEEGLKIEVQEYLQEYRNIK